MKETMQWWRPLPPAVASWKKHRQVWQFRRGQFSSWAVVICFAVKISDKCHDQWGAFPPAAINQASWTVEICMFFCEDQALQQSPSIGMHLDHLHQRHQRRESAIPRVLHVEIWQLGRGQFGCWDLFCSQDQWQAAIKQASWTVEICFAVLHLVKTKIATKANPCVEFWFARPASGCTWTIYIRDIREQKAPPPEYCIWNFGSWAEGSSAAEIFCSQDERQMPWLVRCIPSSGYQAGQLNCWNLLGRFAFCEGEALQQLNQANGLAFWVTACRLLICQTIIRMHLDHPRQRHQRRGSASQRCV